MLPTQNPTHTQTSPTESKWQWPLWLGSKHIDWNGNCIFDDSGKVTGFRIQSQANRFDMLPIPTDKQSLIDAREADRMLSAIMTPATYEQISLSLKRLSLHCGLQAKAPEEVKSMIMDYCFDLGRYPTKLIEQACTEYRTSPSLKKFMPSSGELIGMIKPKYEKMESLRIRIDKVLGNYRDKKQTNSGEKSLSDLIKNI